MFGRSHAKTHAELMRSELGDSLDHFMQAATHGAGAVGAVAGPRWESTKSVVGPRVDQVRDVAYTGWDTTRSAVSPLLAAAVAGATEANRQAQKTASQAKKSAMKTKKSAGKKVDKLRKEKLHKKDTARRNRMVFGLLVVGAAAGAGAVVVARRRGRARWVEYDATFETPVGYETTEPVAAGETPSWRESAADKAASMAEKARNAADKAGDKVKDATDTAVDKTQEMTDKAASAAKNSRNN